MSTLNKLRLTKQAQHMPWSPTSSTIRVSYPAALPCPYGSTETGSKGSNSKENSNTIISAVTTPALGVPTHQHLTTLTESVECPQNQRCHLIETYAMPSSLVQARRFPPLTRSPNMPETTSRMMLASSLAVAVASSTFLVNVSTIL